MAHPVCPVPPKAVFRVADTGAFEDRALHMPIYTPGPEVNGVPTFVFGCRDWRPDRPFAFRNLVRLGGHIYEDDDDDEGGARGPSSFTALIIYAYLD